MTTLPIKENAAMNDGSRSNTTGQVPLPEGMATTEEFFKNSQSAVNGHAVNAEWWHGTSKEQAATLSALIGNDTAFKAELQRCPKTNWQSIRKSLATALGWQLSELDKMRLQANIDTAPTGQGRALSFEPPEPWHESITLCQALDAAEAALSTHLHLPDHAAPVMAVWAAMTWLHADIRKAAPYLFFTGAKAGAGKSVSMNAVGDLSRNGIQAAQITMPALFRTAEAINPVLLFDNVDRIFSGNSTGNSEVKPLLLNAFNRETASVIRCVGDDHEPREFDVWVPVAMNGIGKSSPDLMSRCVVIPMAARPRTQQTPPATDWTGHAEHIQRQIMTSIEAVRGPALDAINDALAGEGTRNADLWRPLAGIAAVAGGKWPDKVKAARAAMSPALEDELSIDERLVLDALACFDAKAEMSPDDLCNALAPMRDDWSEYGHSGKPITPKALAQRLRKFYVVTMQKRDGYTRGQRFYQRCDIEAAIAEHMPDHAPAQTEPMSDYKAARDGV